jgi:hypothetical protein
LEEYTVNGDPRGTGDLNSSLGAASELAGQRYVDAGIGEDGAAAIPNYGIKLSPSEHRQFYDDVQGMSEALPQPEETKVDRPLPLRVRRCCEHPEGEGDFQLFGGVASEW